MGCGGHGIGTRWALITAAVSLGLAAASVVMVPLRDGIGSLPRDLSLAWPAPTLVFEPAPDDGPVQVITTYRVPAAAHGEFEGAMAAVARSRRRTGGRNWHLYRGGGDPDEFVEEFVVDSWSEFTRQRTDRWTEYDQSNLDVAVDLTASKTVEQRHLFCVR